MSSEEKEVHKVDNGGQPICGLPREKGILVTGDSSHATCSKCLLALKKAKEK